MITVLTGDRQAGKTTLCRKIIDLAKANSLDVAGVISPAVFSGGYKTGIDAVDLRSGISRPLAVRDSNLVGVPGKLGYRFAEDVLSWANESIVSAAPCDLLVIDELGPLEIKKNQGFVSAFEVLKNGEYGLALVVVRPELIYAFGMILGLPFSVVQVKDISTNMFTEVTRLLEAARQYHQLNKQV